MKETEIVKKAKERFNKDLLAENYHNIHSDEAHLKALISSLQVKPQGNYMDLGTGNGYIAFELARIYRNIQVYGLDIADEAILHNRKKALGNEIGNITFDTYDGLNIPYQKDFFDGIISRYALHHFPDIHQSIDKISKILRTDGIIVIANPTINTVDKKRFIDNYMQLKDDGHVRFYLPEEFEAMFKKYGLIKEQIFYSSIRFPRVLDERYKKLLNSVPKDILNAYNTKVEGEQIFITLNVMNLVFRKTGQKEGKLVD